MAWFNCKEWIYKMRSTGDVISKKTYTDDNYNRHINYGEENM